MDELTKRQQEILRMIREFIADSGFPPTRADICRAMGFNSPNAAEEHLRTLVRKGAIEMHCQVDAQLFKPRADYLLKVRGLSMRDAGILDGDLLAVHRVQEARSGQVVVARLHDEVTVKRFRRRGNQVQLIPENPDFKIIEVDLNRTPLEIEGIAVGVIRNGTL